jgi:hypothetical protein
MKHTVSYLTNQGYLVIDLTKSAPNQGIPFPRIEELCEHWRSKGYREVVDLGCGQLRNSLVLVKHFRLWICDFPVQLRRPSVSRRLASLKASSNFLGMIDCDDFRRGKVNADAVVIACVLHTLPEVKMRVALIQSAVRNTKSPHEIFIATPNAEYYYRQRMRKDNAFSDGHLFDAGGGCRTFYHEYTASQLDGFMRQLGFELDRSFGADKKTQRTYLKRKPRSSGPGQR